MSDKQVAVGIDERREIARRLRGLNGNISHIRRVYEAEGFSIFCDDQADYYQICDAVAGYLPAEHMHPCDYEELHDRLADLIEPTIPSDPGEAWLASVYGFIREMRHSTKEERDEYNAMLKKVSVELHPVDRDALLKLADDMDAYTECDDERCGKEMPPSVIHDYARRIREALGVDDD